MPHADALRQELLRTHDGYRRLAEEHRECEERLHAIAQRTFPSQEDEAAEKRIKLHKLALKDRMEALARELAAAHAPA